MSNQGSQETVLRDLIQSIASYKQEILTSRKLILWTAILVFLYFGYKQFYTPPQYVAKTSFMLNESGGDNSGISAILGQFGIATPGQQVNLQKIIEIAKTRRIAEKVFLSKAIVEGKEDLIANHFIAILEKYKEWIPLNFLSKKSDLDGFRFTQTEPVKFSTLENIALKNLHSIFLKKLETSYNEKTGIMELTTSSSSQDLSFELSHRLFEELSRFYIDKSVEKQKETYENLKNKVDSIKSLLHGKDYSLAGFKDTYRNTWLVHDNVPQVQLDRDVRMLSVIYAEAVKNMEISSFALENQTPFIQALDLPIKPLELRKQNLINNIIKAIAFTILFSSIFIILRKIIRDNS